jgi:hypothetical protein
MGCEPSVVLLMKPILLCAVVPALVAQALHPSLRELLTAARPLTITEIATVLNASREALTGTTLRVSSAPCGQGPEVLMGAAGQPKIIRTTFGMDSGIVGGIVAGSARKPTETRWHEDVSTIIDYTRRPARHCDGSTEQGEMVIEYVYRSTTNAWTATARRRADVQARQVAPLFEMLVGATAISSEERATVHGRSARAFVSSWTPPAPDPRSQLIRRTGDPVPNAVGIPAPSDATQSLWIGTTSLLPLRWEASKGDTLVDSFDITYEDIDLRPPAGIAAPDCIR